MTSKSSTPNTRGAGKTGSTERSRSATKGAETLRRNKAERRADKLVEIRAQIADGTLVVRQMTVAERESASLPRSRTSGRR
jgi:anti-sigma28 factor (negative regulator of flagellin synthesis)